MKQWILGGVSAAALIASAGTGWSLTAQQAWENWKTAADAYGQSLSSSGEATMDGKLTVSGVAIESSVEEMTVLGTIDEVVFAEQGDGSVQITMSESFPVVLSGTDIEGEKIDLTLSVTQPGMSMGASDANGTTAFSYESPSLSVEITEFKVNDEDFPLTLLAKLDTLAAAYTLGGETQDSMESTVTAKSAVIALNAQDPEGDGELNLDVSIADLASTTTGQNMDMSAMDDMAALLAAGFATEGGATYGASTFSMMFEEDGSSTKADGGLAGGHASVVMNRDQMVYDIAYEGLDVTVSGSEIPFPKVTAQIGQLATMFEIPVQPGDMAAPFALKVALEDLSVGEEIWSMIDPGAVLPRDPATLIVDLGGKARWLVDIFDEEAMMGTQVPGEVEEVSINELKLSIAGAELTGDGAFTLDNTDLATFDGMPRPAGKASLRLVGGNGLLENLTKMGLVPQDQVMMVRMMSGMFAKPGAGEDELLSEIAVDGSGKISINGAPMPF